MGTRTYASTEADLRHKYQKKPHPLGDFIFLALAGPLGEISYGGYARIPVATDESSLPWINNAIVNASPVYWAERTDAGVAMATKVCIWDAPEGGILQHEYNLPEAEWKHITKGVTPGIKAGELTITGS